MASRVGFTDFRKNLASHFDKVVDGRSPLYVTHRKGASVVVISAAEYHSVEETLHLLASPKNAEHLLRGIAELDAGRGVERDPI